MENEEKSDTILEGYWWIPRSKNMKAPGKLNITSTENTLELNGTIVNVAQIHNHQHSGSDIILGELFNGEKITLYKCHLFQATLGQQTTLRYVTEFVFRHAHFTQVKKITFKKIQVNLE